VRLSIGFKNISSFGLNLIDFGVKRCREIFEYALSRRISAIDALHVEID